MGRALEIRGDLTAEELRGLAARERSNRAARRLPVIASALDGMSRADAAAGMERQTMRDTVGRCNAEGPDSVRDPSASGPPAGAERDGAGAALRPDLPRPRARDGRREHVDASGSLRLDRSPLRQAPDPQSLSRILWREGFSRRKLRPTHPKTDEAAQRRSEKGSFARR